MIFSAWLALVPTSFSADDIPLIPLYQIGETAASDVLAPIAFSIPNPEETRRLKELETEQSPLVFRYIPEVGAEAEVNLAGTIARHRSRFMEHLQQSAKRPVLDEATVEHPSFARFVAWCQERDKSFPLTLSLARTWALARSDDLLVANLLEKLQATMSLFICAEPAELKGATRSFRVVEAKSLHASIALAQIQSGQDYPADQLLTLEQARREVEGKFSGEQKAWGRFLMSFVRPTCAYDPGATRRYKEHRLSKIAATDFYQRGELIVSSGELVDARIKRALDLLHAKRLEQDARAALAQQRREKVDSAVALLDRGFTGALAAAGRFVRSEYNPPVAVGICLLLLLWLRQIRKKRMALRPADTKEPAYAVVVNRNRQETIFVPLADAMSATSAPSEASGQLPARFDFAPLPQNGTWEEKVFAAEKRAEELMQLIRAGLAPHLAKDLMGQFVRELLSQRNQLMATQRVSESELTRLEGQFAALQEQLISRLSSYELRNTELEKELAERRKENRELIRMMMGLTRNQQEKVEAVE